MRDTVLADSLGVGMIPWHPSLSRTGTTWQLRHLLLSASIALLPLASSAWEGAAVPGRIPFTGEGYLRCWFKPHPSFFNRHERDLYGESVILNIRSLVGAHEVFVNGQSIGVGGSFPPKYADGREGNHRHKIPSGLLVKDAWNEIRLRLHHDQPEGGFLIDAPFVMNYFQECVLEGEWEFQAGASEEASGQAKDERPARAAFDLFRESSRPLGEAEQLVHGDKLSPAESHARMETAEDLQVELLLHEPLVAQPVHMSFDERGRLWISQYRQYPYPAGLKMVSRDRYYRSHYDKVPPAPPNHTRGRDRITIHEDRDGDGSYETHKVFQDGLNLAISALRGRGGVWVANAPYLLFYPDADFDDVPDGPPEVHLEGFGIEDTHSVANGLVWGMDGWLYGTHGSTSTSRVRRPGIDSPDSEGVYFQGCMVWRYHPERREYELFAEGGGNNFGLELDAEGRLFTGHNGGSTRGWHFIQGGLYLMQGVTPNKFGPPRNPYAFGDLPKMVNDQPVARFTHFAALVEGTALPYRYQKHFFGLDPLHNFIIASRRSPKGSTFETFDQGKVLTSSDPAFRPTYITNAPDGSLLIADFYEHYIAHGQHYQSQIDPTTGRIYRLRGRGLELEQDLNLADRSNTELLDLLDHPNRWHRHTAVRLLGERKPGPMIRQRLEAILHEEEGPAALGALWASHQTAGLGTEQALTGLNHSTAAVRCWTVRLVCDAGERLDPVVYQRLLRSAQEETDAETRSQIAASARRLPADQGVPLVDRLLRRDEDVEDPFLPLLCWWVLESHIEASRETVLSLLGEDDFWRFAQVETHLLPRLMRRFALRGRQQDLLDCAHLLSLAPDDRAKSALMEGFEIAFQGRALAGLPEALADALAEVGDLSLPLRLRLGEEEAVSPALRNVQDARVAVADRIALVRTLGEMQVESAPPVFLRVLRSEEPEALQRALMAALMHYDRPELASELLARFSSLPSALHPATFDLLLSRASWREAFIQALERRSLPPDQIPNDIRIRLSSAPEIPLRERAERLFSEENSTTPGLRTQMQVLEQTLTKGDGNPYAGEAHYQQRCAACHRLFHKGGNVGPDLTTYQRDRLDTLITSIVDPNAEIREGYEYYSVTTTDGQLLSGFRTDEDPRSLVLRGLAGEDLRILKDEILELTPMERSLMPENLLDGLTEQQLRDLFAYLRISQPISK